MAAEQFVVRDQAGRTRAELGVDQDNQTGLTLRDPDGTRRAVLATTEFGTELGLFDESGRKLVNVEVNDVPSVNLPISMEQAAVELWYATPVAKGAIVGAKIATDRDGGGLLVEGPDGSVAFSITDHSPALELYDKEQHLRAALGSTGLESAKNRCQGAHGRVVARPLRQEGEGDLQDAA